MEPDFILDRSRFERTFARFIAYSTRSLEEELRNQARLFVLDVVRVTPPFHQGSGQNATRARKVGERSIERNLDRLFATRRLTGSRRITHVFGRRDVRGLPYVVPARERWPDVEAIYASRKRRAATIGGRGLRFPKEKLWVSRTKVQRILRREKRKVGFLAAGWMAAAEALGAAGKVPAFVRRHAWAPGSVVEDFSGARLRIEVTNAVRYADRVGGMRKRANFALRKRTDAMRAQIPRLARLAARELQGV